MSIVFLRTVFVSAFMLLSGCQSPEVTKVTKPTPSASAANQYSQEINSFVEYFKKKRFGVEISNKEKLYYFPVLGQAIYLNSLEKIYIFEFKDLAQAEQEARKVDSQAKYIGDSGSIGWISTPHFYKKGNIIVEYVGTEKAVITGLQELYGPQFAGA